MFRPPARRAYNTLIERTSTMPLPNMDTTAAITLLQTCYLDYGLHLPVSLLLIQGSLRLTHLLYAKVLASRIDDSHYMQTQFFQRLIPQN